MDLFIARYPCEAKSLWADYAPARCVENTEPVIKQSAENVFSGALVFSSQTRNLYLYGIRLIGGVTWKGCREADFSPFTRSVARSLRCAVVNYDRYRPEG